MKLYVKEPNGDIAITEVPSINAAITLYPMGTMFSDIPFPVEEKPVEVAPVVEEKKPRAKAK
jgi:hypothetical protein